MSPLFFASHSIGGLFLLWSVAQMVAGWTLAFMFQVRLRTKSLITNTTNIELNGPGNVSENGQPSCTFTMLALCDLQIS